MRRLVPLLCLGLALAVPAVTRADEPGLAQITDQLRHDQANGFTTHYGGHICAQCAAKLPKRIPADANGTPLNGPIVSPMAGPVMASAPGTCTACQGGAATVMPYSPDGSGMAFVGGEAPGYASVGMLGSTEPAPVGVMRTNYQNGAGPGLPMGALPMGAPPMAPGPYGPNAMPARAAAGWGQPPMAQSMSYPGHRRPHMLGHILGFRSRRSLGAARVEREREAHAAIRYDSPATSPEALPASMVYGNR